MLGRDYPGYFEPGDASGLAGCLVRSLEEPRFLALLEKRSMRRAGLFAPSAETRAVERLAAELLRHRA
jgi:hypothetical protein